MQRACAQACGYDGHMRIASGENMHISVHPRNYSQHIGHACHCSDVSVNILFALYFMQGNAARVCTAC